MEDQSLPWYRVREIAAAAQCDPKTVTRVLTGLPTKPIVGDRIRRQLSAAGITYPGQAGDKDRNG